MAAQFPINGGDDNRGLPGRGDLNQMQLQGAGHPNDDVRMQNVILQPKMTMAEGSRLPGLSSNFMQNPAVGNTVLPKLNPTSITNTQVPIINPGMIATVPGRQTPSVINPNSNNNLNDILPMVCRFIEHFERIDIVGYCLTCQSMIVFHEGVEHLIKSHEGYLVKGIHIKDRHALIKNYPIISQRIKSAAEWQSVLSTW
eukprot:CAMPEP_0114985408 /NCGR_PEP_ID=MMETSP0216-20121206/7839_1 /TAXON_ID=223996 /ORGANISM="Protocruzia adherens, Strain Boccale" /LENGTH=198 /DNA_ID=CAMNT_0002347699 /DNA_START=56 /DNA_END=649 /DNA_ORIENTATION=+